MVVLISFQLLCHVHVTLELLDGKTLFQSHSRGVASIGLSRLEPPLCLPKVGSVGGPTIYGCTIAWPDKLKLHDKLYKIYN